jgi:hypothetical protein
MATLSKGKTFTNGETVTPQKLHELVDLGTVSGIVNADIAAGAAIADSKLAQITTAGKVLPAAVQGTAVVTADPRLSDARTPVSHTHDDRYYTETEMNALLAGKQASGSYAPATGIAQSAVTNLTTDLAGKAASSHTHGNITNAGAIGATAYLPVVTGTNGQLTTINSGQSGQILSSSGGSSAPFWANPVNSGSTVISPNDIPNTVVQRDATGSFYANTVQLNNLNVVDNLGNIMFAVSPTNLGVVSVGLPIVNTGTPLCDFYRNGNQVGSITTSGTTGVAYNTSSDHRLKTNLEPLSNAVARLLQIPVRRFNWLADPNGAKVDGFLAHEAQAIVPESVTGHKDEVDAEGKPIHQGIDQSKLVPLLVAAVQELAARVAALETR